MRLAAAHATSELDLEKAVGAILDRRLLTHSPRPVAVALSGGGDSLALLLAAAAWARSAGRPLLVLTVDHRLRPESAAWTQACAAAAARLGFAFRSLIWTGEKPSTGLPAAARAARHRLLADGAREAGARVILLGHTGDDVREAGLMRAAGSTTPDPREWAPSPAWPQGRGLFLLRPMLGVHRAEIRDWLTARGETWIDDPANEDVTYARPRARRTLAGAGPPPASTAPRPSAASLAESCRANADGELQIARADLRAAAPPALARFVAGACLCAAGTDRPPRREKLERLMERLVADADFTATLAGARIEAGAMQVRFRREPGEAARGGLAPLCLDAGETAVWDGRFEITADRALDVRAVAGSARPTVADAKLLAYERLLAACGAVEREPA